ncbi:VPA1262 family N-terminal domain-containing protein [Burkholderia sp. SRS-25]|uniref:VPA1262 family N-terminal domain-containing protein n=1 Tax=Burkholderia sp. SRS-25 TaxID=2094190 RepID=UPI0010460609|nr:VPA1262 family N-terminal domain-containing protein [Burkholderia sp. SRS-25]
MPTAITVFGLADPQLAPTVCHVELRSVRGSGAYPPPHLPRDFHVREGGCIAIPGTELELVTWDELITADQETKLLADIEQGTFCIPDDCPIAGGQTISGQPYGPLVIEEWWNSAPISGVGLLYRSGIATTSLLQALVERLEVTQFHGTVPKALKAIESIVGSMSGVAGVLGARQSFGSIAYFSRLDATANVDGPLFDIVPVKPDAATKTSMRCVVVRRRSAPLNKGYTLQVRLGNFDEILGSELVRIASNVGEVVVKAPSHITDISVSVFDESGQLVDAISRKFTQQIQFNLLAFGLVDSLPSPFPGAPPSPDLENRARIHTASFVGPSAEDRSGGLDILRKNHARVSTLIGPQSASLESTWFEQGIDGQLEVIRWIKEKLEKPGLVKAFLADPYLGSSALERVVARQGNETAELIILVSPGKVDPDADSAATTATNDYLEKLKSLAKEWEPKLAGKISITHIKRGDGKRQAFHDRYLCLVDQSNTPNVFLLSNSLSKAAGDWPFAICKLDQITAWRVYTYILELVGGELTGLVPDVIWERDSESTVHTSTCECQDVTNIDGVPSKNSTEILLSKIWNIVVNRIDYQDEVQKLIAEFFEKCSEDIDVERFGVELFKIIRHRDAIVIFVSSLIRDIGKIDLANRLDEQYFAQVFSMVPDVGKRSGWFLDPDARGAALTNLGLTIARKPKATNFVLSKLNTKVARYLADVETQRYEHAISWDAHVTALYLSVIALKVSVHASAPEDHRIGIATDYIHFIGRLMRSRIAENSYIVRERNPNPFLDHLPFVAAEVANVRRSLGNKIEPAINLIFEDPWIVPIFEKALRAALA